MTRDRLYALLCAAALMGTLSAPVAALAKGHRSHKAGAGHRSHKGSGAATPGSGMTGTTMTPGSGMTGSSRGMMR